MQNLSLPQWLDFIDTEKAIEISSMLPVFVSFDSLLKDVKDWFTIFPDKEVCVNLRQFLDYPTLEFVKKNDEEHYTIAYIVFFGDFFRLVLNIEDVLVPMMNQLAVFDPIRWCYSLRKIPREARHKCPVLCGLLDRMNIMHFGEYSLFHFERLYKGVHLVYSDITDLYSSVDELIPHISNLLKLSDVLAQEVLSAGILDATTERQVRNIIRTIRRILILTV